MNRAFIRIAAVGAGLVLLVTGCSGVEPGDATPGSTTVATAGTSTTSSTSSGDDELAGVKPCDLLTPDEATGLGFAAEGEPDRLAGSEACNWTVSGNGGLLVAVNTDQGIKDLNYTGAATSAIEIGKYEATKVEEPSKGKGICHVVIHMSDSSSVQVAGNMKATSTDTAAACDRATRAAELIAPKLP